MGGVPEEIELECLKCFRCEKQFPVGPQTEYGQHREDEEGDVQWWVCKACFEAESDSDEERPRVCCSCGIEIPPDMQCTDVGDGTFECFKCNDPDWDKKSEDSDHNCEACGLRLPNPCYSVCSILGVDEWPGMPQETEHLCSKECVAKWLERQ